MTAVLQMMSARLRKTQDASTNMFDILGTCEFKGLNVINVHYKHRYNSGVK